MKLASFLTLASLAVSTAFAQGIQIAYPLPNTTITPGCNITVTVVKPVRILPNHVVLALALK
jgi:hypothetical protein